MDKIAPVYIGKLLKGRENLTFETIWKSLPHLLKYQVEVGGVGALFHPLREAGFVGCGEGGSEAYYSDDLGGVACCKVRGAAFC